MLDNLNKEIINYLKQDGRYSCAKLAKELGVNVATVTKRIEKMLEEDVFAIKTILNPFKFGFNTHALIALDIELNKLNQVCSRLVNNPNISLVASIFGRYDIMILADFPSWEMLQEFIIRELPKGEGIIKIDTFPIIEIKKIYHGLFGNYSVVNTPPQMDEMDLTIIEELGKNGRLSFADLSKKLDISLTTVSRRVAHLKDEELIKITAVRNPAKWGFLANAYFVVHADLNKVNSICNKLSVYPEVHFVATLMSGYEILAGIHLSSLEIMYEFIVDNIAPIDGVLNIETFVCAETRKRSYAIFDPDER
jgi:Lrp/AsnC family transcriptional regulator, regulator for asnA, asnC and gidA